MTTLQGEDDGVGDGGLDVGCGGEIGPGVGCVLGDEAAYAAFAELISGVVQQLDLARQWPAPSQGIGTGLEAAGAWRGQQGRVDMDPNHVVLPVNPWVVMGLYGDCIGVVLGVGQHSIN